MARLSKADLGARGRFVFQQQEVEIPEISTEDNEPGSVLVRTPSVGQRDTLTQDLPDELKDWKTVDVATLCSVVVVDPKLSKEEWLEFLGDWPGTALDRIVEAWMALNGTEEELRQSAGDFRGTERASS